jgi:4-methyl-5(b-hydroxyethyl)-thiazole monophosphate biosynthesis
MTAPRIAVLLAEGFEEIEAITIIDVLRRAEFDVVAAAADPDAPAVVTGAHAVGVVPDCTVADLDAARLDMLVLPGGMPGSTNLAGSEAVKQLVQEVRDAGGWLAAICAAPIALQAAGVLAGKRVTCYPSFEKYLEGAVFTGRTVECDGKLVTSRGPGTALVFALELVRQLGKADVAAALRRGMLVDAPDA